LSENDNKEFTITAKPFARIRKGRISKVYATNRCVSEIVESKKQKDEWDELLLRFKKCKVTKPSYKALKPLPIAAYAWPDVLYKAVARVHDENTTYTLVQNQRKIQNEETTC